MSLLVFNLSLCHLLPFHLVSSLQGADAFFGFCSPAKKIAKKAFAPLRLSSLMLLFQGHVACCNITVTGSSSLLIPLLIRKDEQERTLEWRLTIVIISFQPKIVLYLPSQFQTSLSQVIAPCPYPLACESPSVDYLVE